MVYFVIVLLYSEFYFFFISIISSTSSSLSISQKDSEGKRDMSGRVGSTISVYLLSVQGRSSEGEGGGCMRCTGEVKVVGQHDRNGVEACIIG